MDKKYRFIVNNLEYYISIINSDYIYEVVNDSYLRAIHLSREQIIGKSIEQIWGKEKFNELIKKHIDDCLSGSIIKSLEKFKFGKKDKFMSVTYLPYPNEKEVTHAVVFSQDVSNLKRIESRMLDYQYKDPVTGLFNRKLLDSVLEMEIDKAMRSQSEKLRAILIVRVENFSRINEIYGHTIGDLIFENTGQKIKSSVRESDFVFHFAGSEFVVLLTSISKATDVAVVAAKILENTGVSYQYNEYSITIKCHIGISIFPDDGDEKETLIKNATIAVNEAMRKGGDFIVFNKLLAKNVTSRLKMEARIKMALEEHEFELFFQPILNKEGVICGAEALIRWNHPEKGLILPAEFIPVAEENGMINAISKWALLTVCEKIKTIFAPYNIYISVNLSAFDFRNRHIVDTIENALAAFDINPALLKLEITESKALENPLLSINLMEKIKKLGIGIFVDDFGTGYSSLSYLKILPADLLKVDKSFIEAVDTGKAERQFMKGIIFIAKSQGKKVLVEGVSTASQYRALRRLGCDRYQGYYFSTPVQIGDFVKLLEEKKCWDV